MIVAVAPAVAPIVGGWILGWGHWTFIFWCLAAFSMLLLALTWLWLPETHPAQARERAGVARLLRDYVAIFLNPRFQRLAAASAFTFAALFLFTASAPPSVLEILGLYEVNVGGFFVPLSGGFS